MTSWIIKDEEEARRAFKKIFINLFENNITFEEEYFYNKDKTRTNFFRDIFNIPDEITYDIDALLYITDCVKDIIVYHDLKFPFVMVMPNFNDKNAFEMFNLNKDFKFEHEDRDISLPLLEKYFNENNVSVEFNKCGVSVPISFEDLKKILNKYLKKRIKKTGNKICVYFEDFEFTLYLNKKEMNNA